MRSAIAQLCVSHSLCENCPPIFTDAFTVWFDHPLVTSL
jgi:hypothetical protein